MVYCEHDIAILQKMTRYDYHQIYYHSITIILYYCPSLPQSMVCDRIAWSCDRIEWSCDLKAWSCDLIAWSCDLHGGIVKSASSFRNSFLYITRRLEILRSSLTSMMNWRISKIFDFVFIITRSGSSWKPCSLCGGRREEGGGRREEGGGRREEGGGRREEGGGRREEGGGRREEGGGRREEGGGRREEGGGRREEGGGRREGEGEGGGGREERKISRWEAILRRKATLSLLPHPPRLWGRQSPRRVWQWRQQTSRGQTFQLEGSLLHLEKRSHFIHLSSRCVPLQRYYVTLQCLNPPYKDIYTCY